MTWQQFKKNTEKHWQDCEVYSGAWGFQIQAGTKWSSGMTEQELASFEVLIGFCLPVKYKEMLLLVNGLDKDCIDVRGSQGEAPIYQRRCYKYPNDWQKTKWLRDLINQHPTNDYVKEALQEEGFDPNDIVGYVPMYGHRALVVFTDSELTPVLSVVSNDVIVYGNDLMKYWQNEFRI